MTLKSRNISYDSIVKIEERCHYTENKNNSTWTDLHQEAVVHAYPFGVSGNIEKFLTSKFIRNAPLGRQIMEHTVKSVEEENDLKNTFSSLIKETKDFASEFEKRYDLFKEDLCRKIKETEDDLTEFYDNCTSWTNERMQEVEYFLENRFDTIFVADTAIQENIMEKQ